jgi:hypothetical protein
LRDYRETNVVLKGNFLQTDVNAVFANKGDADLNSNKIEPFWTLVIHSFTLPLPLPIRVSLGLAVTGICGKILVNNVPFLFKDLLIVMIAAFNCVLVTNDD